MENSYIAITLFGLLFALILIISYFADYNLYADDGREKVYVQSIFGCVQLSHEYTPEEWEAKQQLNEVLEGGRLRVCN